MTIDRTRPGYEPRFDIDYEYGRQGELFVDDVLRAASNGRVEVKRDGLASTTQNIYVEYACDKGRTGVYQPSGIAVTEAEFWAVQFGDSSTCVIIGVSFLRELTSRDGVPLREERDGSCPTKGYCVPIRWLIQESRRRAASSS